MNKQAMKVNKAEKPKMVKVKLGTINDTRGRLQRLLDANFDAAFGWDLIRLCAPIKQAEKDYDAAVAAIVKNHQGKPSSDVNGGMIFPKEHTANALKKFNDLRERETTLELGKISAAEIQDKIRGEFKPGDILALDYLIEFDIVSTPDTENEKE